LIQIVDQVRNFNSGAELAKVVFAIGLALKGHFDNEQGGIFGKRSNFDTYIGPANQALRFYQFQLQSYRKAVDSWTIIGFRNGVVRDIRKMIGKMSWDAREEAPYLEEKPSAGIFAQERELDRGNKCRCNKRQHKRFLLSNGLNLQCQTSKSV
jgi:hypothetical protein